MAEYRRFISYMYLYEDGKKTINSGFVRVESRNGQCRVQVHMTGSDDSENGMYRMYMLIRDAGDYIGVAVGRLTMQQQMGDTELMVDSEHLADSEYNLDCVTGMVLLGEDGSIYGTRWDDEPLETGKFVNIEQLSGNLVRFGEHRHADENPLIPEEEVLAKETESETESEIVIEQEKTPNVYEQMMAQLPSMYPFEDDQVGACVRLELQDIGRMPMSCWAYGSNSFLLHGYYCYRYLILAKLGSECYLLGVPGLWQHREQYMASMFGFREFRPVSRENYGNGAFGYWCVALKE